MKMRELSYIYLIFLVSFLSCNTDSKETVLSNRDALAMSDSLNDSLFLNTSVFKQYRTFNEFKMCGEEVVNQQDESSFVLVKETTDSIVVIRSEEPNRPIVYKRKSWGWYNKMVVKEESDIFREEFFRYVLNNQVLEFSLLKSDDKVLHKHLLVTTNEKCVSYRLDNTFEWNEDSLPDISEITAAPKLEYSLVQGKKNSYFLTSANESKDVICYAYALGETTTFLRSPGLEYRSIHSGTYSYHNEAFTNVEVMPIVEEDIIGEYILSHSSPLIKEYVERDKIIVWLKISESGRIEDVVLLRPRDEIMARQLCHTVPIHCIPGTIAEKPVAVWYTMILRPNKH